MDDSPAPSDVPSVVAGKYAVERVLGQGGMGRVLAARHMQLGNPVAIKCLLPEAARSAPAVARFLREAKAALSIQSEHVVRVLDFGTLEDGAPFLVMEHLAGKDLDELLRERGPLPVDEAIDYVLQACEAIAEAHVHGIVHRDLKPANLFLTRRTDGTPFVKVLDFGISKTAESDANHSLTATTAVMGSPYYMSPEQVRSTKKVDARTDIWALGVILHELLTGKTPFAGETLGAVYVSIVTDPPPPMSTLRAGLPPALEQAILRCLEKDPSRRTPDVASLARGLLPFAPERGRASVERIARLQPMQDALSATAFAETAASHAIEPRSPLAHTDASWGGTLGSPGKAGQNQSRKALYIGAGAALAAVITIGAVMLTRKGPAPPPAASQTPAVTATAASPQPVPDPAPPPSDVPVTAPVASSSASLPTTPAVKPAALPATTAAKPKGPQKPAAAAASTVSSPSVYEP